MAIVLIVNKDVLTVLTLMCVPLVLSPTINWGMSVPLVHWDVGYASLLMALCAHRVLIISICLMILAYNVYPHALTVRIKQHASLAANISTRMEPYVIFAPQTANCAKTPPPAYNAMEATCWSQPTAPPAPLPAKPAATP